MSIKLIGAILAIVVAGGSMYVLAYPYLSGEMKAKKRQAAFVSGSQGRQASRGGDQARRRKAITDSLGEVEGRKTRVDLKQKIQQAGLELSTTAFYLSSGVCGLILSLIVYFVSASAIAAAGALLVGGLGLPNWILNHLCRRRVKKFINEFPASIDVIVRGMKAGLPLGDCFRIVAVEAAEPVRDEFVKIVEAQAVGMTMAESVERFAARVPIPEVSFFSIVISMQQKAGGNLSESLSNLSAVLRDRKKMKEKVKAISAEAKASAGIIGSLPFLVSTVVYFFSPGYMDPLLSTGTGHMIIFGCLMWMAIGVFIMRQMINFDF